MALDSRVVAHTDLSSSCVGSWGAHEQDTDCREGGRGGHRTGERWCSGHKGEGGIGQVSAGVGGARAGHRLQGGREVEGGHRSGERWGGGCIGGKW